MNLQSIILLTTALFIFGEALVLLIGTAFILKSRPSWLSQKNFAFLADDMFFGIVLVLVALGVFKAPWIFWLSVVSTFLSHSWRDAEFAAKFPNRFCDNRALFVVNNLKLAGLLFSVLLR